MHIYFFTSNYLRGTTTQKYLVSGVTPICKLKRNNKHLLQFQNIKYDIINRKTTMAEFTFQYLVCNSFSKIISGLHIISSFFSISDVQHV